MQWNEFELEQLANLTPAAPSVGFSVLIGASDWEEANDVVLLRARGWIKVANNDVAIGTGLRISVGLIAVNDSIPVANLPAAFNTDEDWWLYHTGCIPFAGSAAGWDGYHCEIGTQSKRRLQQPIQTNLFGVITANVMPGSAAWTGTVRVAVVARILSRET